MARLKELTVSQKGLILIALPTFLAVVFLSAVGFMLYQSQDQASREMMSARILAEVQSIGLLGNEAIRMTTRLNGNSARTRKRYQFLLKRRDEHFRNLSKLTKWFGELSGREERWEATTRRIFQLIQAIDDSSFSGEGSSIGLLRHRGVLRELSVLLAYESLCRRDLVMALENVQRESRINIAYWNNLVTRLVMLALPLNAVLSLTLVLFYGRNINQRLAALVDNSKRLAAGDSLLPMQGGEDEIGRLDVVFHRMAEELESRVQHEKAILEKAADVICTLNSELQFGLVNLSVTRVWGYSIDELTGKELATIVHAEDIDFVEAKMDEISSGNSEGDFECRLKRKDGAVVHSSFSVSWLDDTREYYLVAHDITERKLEEALVAEREQFIRLVIERMPLGLLVVDSLGIIERSNRSLKQLLSFEETDLAQRPFQSIFLENSVDPVLRFMCNPGTAPGAVHQATLRTKNGDSVPAEVTLSEFWWKGERLILIVIQDITFRLEVERLKREFIAMVSHDLRSPLSTMMMSMELLQGESCGFLNQEGHDQAVLAQDEMERLIALVSTLLDIEKFQDGQMEIHRQRVDIGKMVKHSADAVAALAQANGIEIDTEVSSFQANVDEGALTQVLVNLTNNAIKFSPRDSKIRVRLQRLGDSFEVHIIDKGRGIPDSHRESIFERFKQVEVSDRTEKKGSGLGLAISKLIVEAHGGEIGVSSNVGEGSDFWFRVPGVLDDESVQVAKIDRQWS